MWTVHLRGPAPTLPVPELRSLARVAHPALPSAPGRETGASITHCPSAALPEGEPFGPAQAERHNISAELWS